MASITFSLKLQGLAQKLRLHLEIQEKKFWNLQQDEFYSSQQAPLAAILSVLNFWTEHEICFPLLKLV